MTPPDDPIQDAARAASRQLNLRVEQQLRTILAPKPRWLPRPLWRYLLRRLLVIQVSTPAVMRSSKRRKLRALTLEDLIATPAPLEAKLQALVTDPRRLASELERRLTQGRFQPHQSQADRITLLVIGSLWPELVTIEEDETR